MDLNNDGYTDIVSGRYYPNDAIWFKGGKDGYSDGEVIKERRRKIDRKTNRNQRLMISMYKCTPRMGDIDNDGDLDLFVTDFTSVYINKNTGDAQNPVFGRREFVTTTEGDTIGRESPVVAIADWDSDGYNDIVLSDNNDAMIYLYRGNGTDVFEPAVPLIRNKKNKKVIPGGAYWICVTDWNNDGKPDLLVGSKITYKDGKFHKKINMRKGYLDQLRAKKSREEMREVYKGIKTYGEVFLLEGK